MSTYGQDPGTALPFTGILPGQWSEGPAQSHPHLQEPPPVQGPPTAFQPLLQPVPPERPLQLPSIMTGPESVSNSAASWLVLTVHPLDAKHRFSLVSLLSSTPQWSSCSRRCYELDTPSLQVWKLRHSDVCRTGSKVAQLAFKQWTVRMMKTAGPTRGNGAARSTRIWKNPQEVRDSSWANTALGRRSTDRLKAHFSLPG